MHHRLAQPWLWSPHIASVTAIIVGDDFLTLSLPEAKERRGHDTAAWRV
jgi:hypothetical protein